MGTIHLVRHGQASFGSADYDRLSDLGLRQSALLGEWLARIGQPADRVVCGTLRRHRQTAEACLTAWGAPPEIAEDVGFNEFDHRDILARARPDLAEDGALARLVAGPDGRRAFQQAFAAAVERWMAGGHDGEYAEPWPTFRARCVAALGRVVSAGGDVWVFTSGGPIAALVQHVLGLSDARMLELNWGIANAGITRLVQGGRRLGGFNNVAHLEAAGGGALITYR
jgi:broad specificity phosphatase PhoE